jgi:anti-anti-sigma regulatory factor
MLTIHADIIGDTAVIDCEGRLAGFEASYDLQEAVTSQSNSRTIVLDLTELYEIDDTGLRMLATLQEWAIEKDIQLKLFNPKSAVRNRLQHNPPLKSALATYTEIVLLAQPDASFVTEHAKAA